MRTDPVTGMKTCPRCKESKPVSSYQITRSEPDGLCVWCRECKSVYAKAHYSDNKDQKKAWDTAYRELHPERLAWKGCRERARKKSLPFTITEEDIHIPDECPLCGCFLKRGNGAATNASPSVDRYIAALGYVHGNIWVICNMCNNRKVDMSGEEHIAFGFRLIEAFKQEQERRAT